MRGGGVNGQTETNVSHSVIDSKLSMHGKVLLGVTSVVVLVTAASGGMGLWADESTATPLAAATADASLEQRGGYASSSQRAGQPQRQPAPDPLPPARWPWWRDADVQRTVGLSADQVQRLDAIVKEREEALAPFIAEWRRQLEVLNQMARERQVSIEEFSIQASRVDSLYTKLTESRTIMLYRMSRELSDEQYAKLQEVRDRRSRGGNRGSLPNR